MCSLLADELSMSYGEIASALSIPKTRVSNAITMYKSVPDKYKAIVEFHLTGTDKKGLIPTGAMNSIIRLRRRAVITQKQMEELIELTRKKDLTQRHIILLSSLLARNISFNNAVEKLDEYRLINITTTLTKREQEYIQSKFPDTTFGNIFVFLLAERMAKVKS